MVIYNSLGKGDLAPIEVNHSDKMETWLFNDSFDLIFISMIVQSFS